MAVPSVARVAVLAVVLCACGEARSADGSDGAAVAACRSVLEQLTEPERLATTVRDEGDGFVVSAWRSGQADGQPDYLCQVEREDSADRGVAVVKVHTRDGSGGYRSTLDLDLDDEP